MAEFIEEDSVEITVTEGGEVGPTAYFVVDSVVGLRVYFNAAGSTPGSSAIVSWSWDFGDSGTSADESPFHDYAAAGFYSVILTVTDENALTDIYNVVINVGGDGGGDDYLPIAGVCGQVDAFYATVINNIAEDLTWSETNTDWTIDWAAVPDPLGMRFFATFTALVDLDFDSVIVLGATCSSDGGFGAGAQPSQVTATSSAIDPEVDNVSGVTLDPVESSPSEGAAAVSVTGVGTFTEGTSFRIAFTVPSGFPTYFGVFLPGIETIPEDPLSAFFDLTIEGDSGQFGFVFTGACGEAPCSASLVFNGTYETEPNETIGDYTLWRPTFNTLDGGGGSLYFMGTDRAPIDAPALVPLTNAPNGTLAGPLPQPGYTLGHPFMDEDPWPEATLTGYRITGPTCGSYTLYLYGRRMTEGGPIEVFASTDGTDWVEVPV